MRWLLFPVLMFPALSAAGAVTGEERANVRVSIVVLVPPVFKILHVTSAAGGYEYRAWTNMNLIVINGREYRFDRVGEQTLSVPAANEMTIVHGL